MIKTRLSNFIHDRLHVNLLCYRSKQRLRRGEAQDNSIICEDGKAYDRSINSIVYERFKLEIHKNIFIFDYQK